jgi:NADH-quinone oxidoreductase subunit L
MPHGEEHGSRRAPGTAREHGEGGEAPAEAAAEDGHAVAAEAAPAEGEADEAVASEVAEEVEHGSEIVVGAHPAPLGGAIAMNEGSEAVLDAAHHSPVWVKLSPFLAMLVGTGLAYLMYMRQPGLPRRLADTNRPLYEFLLNKWYFDEIYDWIFVRPAVGIGRFLWRRGDETLIDGTINGVSMGIVPTFTRAVNRVQSGYVFHYAFAMVIGLAILLSWFTITGGTE